MTRTGPASLITGAGVLSVDGPIATESSRVMAGATELDGSDAAAAVVFVLASLVEVDKGATAGIELEIAAFEDSFCDLVFSLAEELDMVGKEESRGEDSGIETSLRLRPCDPAPVLFDASSSLISTGILPEECGCEDGERSRGTEAEAGPPPVAVVDCAIIGWVLAGV